MKNKQSQDPPKRGRGRPRKYKPDKIKKISKIKKRQDEHKKVQDIDKEQKNDKTKKQQVEKTQNDKDLCRKDYESDQKAKFKLLIQGLNQLKNILKSDNRKKKKHIQKFDNELDELKQNVRFKKLNDKQQRKLFIIIKKIRSLESYELSKTFEKIWKKVQKKYNSQQQKNTNLGQESHNKELNLLQESPERTRQISSRRRSNQKNQNSNIKSKRLRKNQNENQEKHKRQPIQEDLLVDNQEQIINEKPKQKDITSINEQVNTIKNQKVQKEVFKNDHSILTFGNSTDTPIRKQKTEEAKQMQENSQFISEQENIFQMELSFQQELENKKKKQVQKRNKKIDKSEYQALQKYQYQKEDEIAVVLDPKKQKKNIDSKNYTLKLIKRPLKNRKVTVEVSSSSFKQF